MKLVVVVVSYNTRDLLDRCLAATLASAEASGLDDSQFQIVVVDNASVDGSAEMTAQRYPQVRLIASDSNLGFTGGNNLALAYLGFPVALPAGVERPALAQPDTRPDYVLLLNSDAEPVGDALGRMANFLEANPAAGICGPRLQYGDGRFQHSAFRFPDLFQTALGFFSFSRIRGAHRIHDSRLNGRYPARLWQGETPFRVDFVLGAAMMARDAAIDQVGGLDNDYYMYCEEIDWCMRMDDAGWGVFAVPAALVTHHAGQSSKQIRWQAYVRLWRSRLLLTAKHPQRYPPGYLHLMRGLIRFGSWWDMAGARRRFARGEITGAELAAELAAHAEVMRL